MYIVHHVVQYTAGDSCTPDLLKNEYRKTMRIPRYPEKIITEHKKVTFSTRRIIKMMENVRPMSSFRTTLYACCYVNNNHYLSLLFYICM